MSAAANSVLLSDNDTPVNVRRKLTEPELLRLFHGDDVFGTTLLTFCIDRFGLECLDWTPSTLQHELAEDYRIRLDKFNFGKLMAAMSIVQTDDFFQRQPMFCTLTEALCGNGLRFDIVALPDTRECAWAITEAMLLLPDEEYGTEQLFVPEISAFIGKLLREEGLYSPPNVLRVAAGSYFQPDYDSLALGNPTEATGILGAKQDDADDMADDTQLLLRQLMAQLQQLPLENGDTMTLI